MATRAQSIGSVKDIQAHSRPSRADTAANEYMQELPESVQQMVGTVYAMLTETTAQQRVMYLDSHRMFWCQISRLAPNGTESGWALLLSC